MIERGYTRSTKSRDFIFDYSGLIAIFQKVLVARDFVFLLVHPRVLYKPLPKGDCYDTFEFEIVAFDVPDCDFFRIFCPWS